MNFDAMKGKICLKSENVTLRPAEMSDARFLFDLRRDSKHIEFIDPFNDYDAHVTWLEEHLYRNDDYLFIVEDIAGNSRGTTGLSEIDFCKKVAVAGRWVMQSDFLHSMEAGSLCNEFAFGKLFLNTLLIDVPKNNTRVLAANKFAGFVVQSENFLFVRGKQVPSFRLAQTSTEWKISKEKLKELGILPPSFPNYLA